MNLPRCLAFALLSFLAAGLRAFAADTDDWPDGTGARFRGEPASVFGPLALFRTKEAVLSMLAGDIFGKTPIWSSIWAFNS